ncbi:MAG: SusC/RagA family TonB-linked outer membrane protein [Bacteroidota bacterium]
MKNSSTNYVAGQWAYRLLGVGRWLFLFALWGVASVALAQERTISGKVTSAKSSEVLPGVNVIVKGTTLGTVTDIDGNYRLNVPESAEVLQFSFIGYQAIDVVIGGQSTIDVAMNDDVKQLSEVVVTAIGIEREQRELGYAVSTVDGEELTKVRSDNALNGLAGRVPGVRVTNQSGTAGGSVQVQIRGANSLAGTSQPLFVVDGVPISNNAFNGTRNDIIGGGADVGNRAGDLNPDDIENISVLKGASAVALYGQRARDGVIIITTKRGEQGQASIEVNSSLRFDRPFRLPDLQNEYAQGDFGVFDSNNFTNGWGPRISEVQGQNFPQFPYNGEDRPLQAFPDNVSDFYETGTTLINSVSFGTANEMLDFRLGYTNLNQKGIIPGNELNRNTVSINTGAQLTDKVKARASINYVRTEGIGRPRQGSNDPNLVVSQVNGLPRTLDTELLRNNVIDENGGAIGVNGNNTSNNPFWVVQNNPLNNRVERMYGNVQLDYDPTDWLNIMGRIGTDFFDETRRSIIRKGTLNRLNGEFDDRTIFQRQVNSDVIATVTKDVTSKIGFRGLVGWNVNQIINERTRVRASDLSADNLYVYPNANATTPENFSNIRRLYGVYTDIQFDYDNFFFVNFTARNDWSSTLPEENNSFFYPGVSTSFIFTDALGISNNILSYGKLRASWANVGSDENPYQLAFTYTPEPDLFTQFVADNTYPHGGQLAFAATNTIPPGNSLLPQNQSTFEIGTELQLFDGRVGIDFTYYNTLTSDQIISVAIPQSTGFEAVRTNIGEVRNRGIEALLSVTPVQTANFNWDMIFNFTRNRQSVEQLAPGLDELALTSGFSGLSVRAEPGEDFGLYGAGWLRNDAGELIINETTGERQVGDRQRFGSIFPDYLLGIQNSFSYKGINLSFLIDMRQGGVLWSNTVQTLRSDGLAQETLANRGQIFIDQGVIENEDGSFRPNDVPVRSMQDFWGTYSGASIIESNIFDATYVKLREVVLSYSLPQSLIGNSFFKKIAIGIEGRNLWLIDSAVPHIDPETNFFGTSLIGEGVEFNSVPSSRSIGFNVQLGF